MQPGTGPKFDCLQILVHDMSSCEKEGERDDHWRDCWRLQLKYSIDVYCFELSYLHLISFSLASRTRFQTGLSSELILLRQPLGSSTGTSDDREAAWNLYILFVSSQMQRRAWPFRCMIRHGQNIQVLDNFGSPDSFLRIHFQPEEIRTCVRA